MEVGTLKEMNYRYVGKEANCTSCGSRIYVPKINDYNLKALYEVYRASNGIISLEHVKEIPKKYAIGKRPLSLLLGWDEQTFSRYYDGDIPTKQYSEILVKIYNEPAYYAELLENRKNIFKSSASYEKSHKAVDILLGKTSDSSDESKIFIAAKYLINQCGDITPLALQKALYYIQGF